MEGLTDYLKRNGMKIIFYDVEHGSCTHIITPNNKHILVDVGSKSDKSVVDYICAKYFHGRNASIDALIITHPHEDHIYDLPNLYQRLKPQILYRPKAAFDIEPATKTPLHVNIADRANDMNATYNSPVPEEDNIENPVNMGGVIIKIIPSVANLQDKEDMNTYSFLVVVEYEGYKFILTGDNPRNQLQYMVNTNYKNVNNLVANATILLAPHHGRTGEFCKTFFDCVNPILTVISDKSIEHATQEESSNIYKGRGAELYGKMRYVLTTRNDGDIAFNISNGNCTVSINEEDYWDGNKNIYIWFFE